MHVHGVRAGQFGPTLDDHVLGTQRVDTASGLDQVVDRVDALHPGQCARLEVVRGDDGGQRQDLRGQGLVGVQSGARLLTLADQDRVEDDVPPLLTLERLLDHVDGVGRAEHAELDHVEVVAGGGGLDLVGDHPGLDRHESMVPVVLRVVGDDAGERAHTVDAEFLESFQIGLDTGSAGGLRACDHVRAVGHESQPLSHIAAVPGLGLFRVHEPVDIASHQLVRDVFTIDPVCVT